MAKYDTQLILIEAVAGLKLGKDTIEIRKSLQNLTEAKINETSEFYQSLAEQIDAELSALETKSQEEPEEKEIELRKVLDEVEAS